MGEDTVWVNILVCWVTPETDTENSALTLVISVSNWNPTPLIKHTTQNHVNRRVRELGYLYTYCHQPLFPTFILLHRQSIRLVVLSAGYTEMVRVPIAFATVGVLAGEGSRRSQAKADNAWLVVRMPGSGVPEVDLANWMLPTFWILSRTNMGLPSLEEMHIQWWWVAP